jgi:hypothetical protein
VRFKYTLVVLLIAVVGTSTLSVVGQEEPLPPVLAKGSDVVAPEAFPLVVLPSDPIVSTQQPTLADAARANDFVTFDALYREARRSGENVSAFATLHELWTYSITDPIGAFYGADMYARFAAAYPGYARYIADYSIIDSRGNVFYPTSETRAFLLERALEGRSARVLIAESSARQPREREIATREIATVTNSETTRSAARRATRRAVVPQRPAAPPQTAAAPSTIERPIATPATVAETPAVVETPAISESPVVVQAEPQVTTPAIASTPEVIAPIAAVPTVPPAATDPSVGNRGILLLVIGLIGVGLLAVMLRTPRETQPTSILTPQQEPPAVVPPQTAATQPPAGTTPVEPIRRPTPVPSDRATGSHG